MVLGVGMVGLPEDLRAEANQGAPTGLEESEEDFSSIAVNTLSRLTSNREQRRVEAEEDRVLIYAAKDGDTAAFRKLVERHQRRAFAIAFGIVRNENDALEISQEAFFRVFRGLAEFQGASSFFTWLFRIVTNLSIDLVRRPDRRETRFLEEIGKRPSSSSGMALLLSPLDGSDPFRAVRRREIAERLDAALDTLPPIHLGVFLMREVEGMSYDEMAEAMGVSQGTIMSRLFHARQKLQEALRDCHQEETGSCDRPVEKPRKRKG